MKRFVSLILSVCFLFSINTVSYAANISSRKASNPVIQSMNDKYHVDFSGMSIDELNKFIDKMKDEDQTRASGNLLLYNKPLECVQLVLSGEIEHYLSLGCDHGKLKD